MSVQEPHSRTMHGTRTVATYAETVTNLYHDARKPGLRVLECIPRTPKPTTARRAATRDTIMIPRTTHAVRVKRVRRFWAHEQSERERASRC